MGFEFLETESFVIKKVLQALMLGLYVFFFSWITKVLSSLVQRLVFMRHIRMSILFFFLL